MKFDVDPKIIPTIFPLFSVKNSAIDEFSLYLFKDNKYPLSCQFIFDKFF